MRSLVVEDDAISRRMLCAFLGEHGQCDTAEDGVLALEAMESAIGDGQAYDLICLDIRMPRMDGKETLRRLRETETRHEVGRGDRAKIIMVTAVFDEDTVLNSIQDWDAYIVKPVDKELLTERLKELHLV